MTRSRGGCATCRKRKRKCDESRPTCLACQKRGVECGGYDLLLQWGNGVASRGHLSGAVIPVKGPEHSSNVVEPSPSSQRGSSSYAGDTSVSSDGPSVASALGSSEHLQYPWDLSQYEVTFDAESKEILQRFFDFGLYELYSTKTDDWIIDGMRTMLEESESLPIACITFQIFREQNMSETFHNYFERCLQVFQWELTGVRGVPKSGTMCAGLLLCTISFATGMRWTTHLICMADLYQLRGKLDHLDPETDRCQHHCLEVMGLMDIPLLVLGRINPSLRFWTRFRQVQTHWTHGTAAGIESVSGYPRTLLDLFARIDDDPEVELKLWLWHDEPGELIQAHLWDASRFAAMLLARRRRRAGSTSTEHTISHREHQHELPSNKYLLWRIISSLEALGLGLEQPENKHLLLSNGTLLPVMAAHLEPNLLRDNPGWKKTLDKFSKKLWNNDGSHNLRVLFEILDEAWESRRDDFNLDQAAISRGMEIALF